MHRAQLVGEREAAMRVVQSGRVAPYAAESSSRMSPRPTESTILRIRLRMRAFKLFDGSIFNFGRPDPGCYKGEISYPTFFGSAALARNSWTMRRSVLGKTVRVRVSSSRNMAITAPPEVSAVPKTRTRRIPLSGSGAMSASDWRSSARSRRDRCLLPRPSAKAGVNKNELL